MADAHGTCRQAIERQWMAMNGDGRRVRGRLRALLRRPG